MDEPDLAVRMKPVFDGFLGRVAKDRQLAAENACSVALDPCRAGRLSRPVAMQPGAIARATRQRARQGTLDRCSECAGPIVPERLWSDQSAPVHVDCRTERDAEREAAR